MEKLSNHINDVISLGAGAIVTIVMNAGERYTGVVIDKTTLVYDHNQWNPEFTIRQHELHDGRNFGYFTTSMLYVKELQYHGSLNS